MFHDEHQPTAVPFEVWDSTPSHHVPPIKATRQTDRNGQTTLDAIAVCELVSHRWAARRTNDALRTALLRICSLSSTRSPKRRDHSAISCASAQAVRQASAAPPFLLTGRSQPGTIAASARSWNETCEPASSCKWHHASLGGHGGRIGVGVLRRTNDLRSTLWEMGSFEPAHPWAILHEESTGKSRRWRTRIRRLRMPSKGREVVARPVWSRFVAE